MNSTLDGSLTAKSSNNTIKLQADTLNTFRTIQAKLSELKITFHSFSITEKRTLKILLRGISSSSIPEHVVKEMLVPLGFELKFISQFIRKNANIPCIWLLFQQLRKQKYLQSLLHFLYVHKV